MSDSFSDLFLLMGTNPLPNYVVASYFINQNENLQRLWLVCSNDQPDYHQRATTTQADKLGKLIKEKFESLSQENRIIQLPLSDVSAANKIQQDLMTQIEDQIGHLSPAIGRIHLNYTGGTKSMSTHVHRILKSTENALPDLAPCDYSYLDSRSFRLILDNGTVLENDLREEVSIDFEDLIKLHGFDTTENLRRQKTKPHNQEESSPVDPFTDAVTVFSNLINDDEDWFDCLYTKPGAWDRTLFINSKEKYSFKSDTIACLHSILDDTIIDKLSAMKQKSNLTDFRKQFCGITKKELEKIEPLLIRIVDVEKKEEEELAKKISQVKDKLLNFHPNVTIKKINDAMPVEFQLFTNGGVNSIIRKDDFKKTVSFFDGKWLEDYVFRVLKEKKLENSRRTIKIEKGWEFSKPEWFKESKDLKFELDVVLMDGYHLTGISCTTAYDKKICKSKGFEIILRTRQIGGDEARSVLVCFASQATTDLLQRELVHETGGMTDNILVLGREDLDKDHFGKELLKFMKIEEGK